ncbi:Transcription factor like [Actinidia chinensis var. chinensis]|uniref:Transcription factor like n=1 Tax=Actinidia chinensis var. chinensis TaxID=1590841 RepID=A0A2R6RJS9_ACTCC|nr:Transcription factor like [Actinidia chinensis var. chinensis]
MNSPTAQFVSLTRMGIYEPIHQMSMWGDFKGNVCPNTSAFMIEEMSTKLNSQSEDTSQGSLEPPNKYIKEAVKPADRVLRRLAQNREAARKSRLRKKVLRRLAQNREAARKSRLRKKAYVQQLETSRLKLIQLEQELAQAKRQGLYISGGLDASRLGYSESVNPGIAAFEMEYVHWVEEQKIQVCELRTALNSHVVEIELRILVDGCMNHYFNLFSKKATAAKADVFYIISGLWKKPAERFFLWIGGFRPSELLKVLMPQFDLWAEQKLIDIYSLRQSCQQAEDALSQGMDKLQQILAESVAAGQQGEGSYIPQVSTAMEKLEALVSFVNQADHLRRETLQQMSRILTTHETAMALLALGEYFQCLQALSSLWASRPREPA